MSETPPEDDLVGPATLNALKVALTISDEDDDARLQDVLDAVNDVVRGLPIAYPHPASDAPWPARVVEGATMLAARVFRRKDSPAGVEVIGTDQVAYVMRSDPDVAMFLQLGTWRPPVIG